MTKKRGLTFDHLRKQNLIRCNSSFQGLDTWAPMDWGCALAGEVGELCNLLKKKYGRNEPVPMEAIEKELADIQIYLDLMAARMRVDLGKATVAKFNEASILKNSKVRL